MSDYETRIKNQPKYKIGQAVDVVIETQHKASNQLFKNTVMGWISQIYADGTDKADTYKYGITTDVPACYHNGLAPFAHVYEDNIVLHKSEQ